MHCLCGERRGSALGCIGIFPASESSDPRLIYVVRPPYISAIECLYAYTGPIQTRYLRTATCLVKGPGCFEPFLVALWPYSPYKVPGTWYALLLSTGPAMCGMVAGKIRTRKQRCIGHMPSPPLLQLYANTGTRYQSRSNSHGKSMCLRRSL